MSAMGLTAHSTWKFNVPHSFGIHHAVNADPYRGPWGRNDADAGRNYAADVKSVIDFATPGQMRVSRRSIQGVGGTVVTHLAFLKQTYEYVRAAGGVAIADEVQTGFRPDRRAIGDSSCKASSRHRHDGQSIGNGCPLAAVVTTPQIATPWPNAFISTPWWQPGGLRPGKRRSWKSSNAKNFRQISESGRTHPDWPRKASDQA